MLTSFVGVLYEKYHLIHSLILFFTSTIWIYYSINNDGRVVMSLCKDNIIYVEKEGKPRKVNINNIEKVNEVNVFCGLYPNRLDVITKNNDISIRLEVFNKYDRGEVRRVFKNLDAEYIN